MRMVESLARKGRVLPIAAVLGAAALLAAPGASAQERLRVIITETEVPLVPNSVMELAYNMGIFADLGLELQIIRVEQTPSAIAALYSGAGDMANVSVSSVVQLVARDQIDLVAVTSPDKALPFLIASRDDIATPADLEGRTFGVGRLGSLDHALSQAVLTSYGVDVGRIDMLALGQPSVRAVALSGGRVDATTISIGVWSSMPETDGLHVLIDAADYFAAAPLLSKVNVVTAATLRDRPEAIAAFVEGIVIASRLFAENPSAWAEAMAEARPDVDRETLDVLAEAYAQSWSVNGGLNLDQVQYTLDDLYQTEDFADLRVVTPEEWVDVSFIDAVLAEHGVFDGMDDPGR